MAEEQDPNRKSGVWIVVVAMLLIFVVYPASTGPFMWLCDAGYVSERSAEVVQSIYLPLGFAMENVPGVDEAVWWYIELWIG